MKTPVLTLAIFCSVFIISHCGLVPKEYIINEYLKDPAVVRFREYLQIDTSQEQNLIHAVEFWTRLARELDLPIRVIHLDEKPICVITWEGADPSLPSIMLNSHMDVVSVETEFWTYSPFDAHIDENGDIYARGAQDDKDVAIQYIEAIRRLIRDKITLQRTIHLTLMPDEETGGSQGMIPFVKSQVFKDMNVGFVLDEGMTAEDETLYATYQDKRPWQMKFTVYGAGAHGSTLPDESAAERLRLLIEAIIEYRDQQKLLRNSGAAYNVLNINIFDGGVATNVLPSKLTLTVDMRLDVTTNVTEMDVVVQSWLAAGGNTTELEWIRRIDYSAITATDDSNAFWKALQSAVSELGLPIEPIVCPATSDMTYVRPLGIPAMGFAPKTHTVSRIHGSNEYLNVATFLRGIDIYVEVLKKIGNVIRQLNSTEITPNLMPKMWYSKSTPNRVRHIRGDVISDASEKVTNNAVALKQRLVCFSNILFLLLSLL